MIRYIRNKTKAFAIYIVRRSAYYQDLNERFHELWMHTHLNNDIDYTRIDKDSLYGKCEKAVKDHSKHYA